MYIWLRNVVRYTLVIIELLHVSNHCGRSNMVQSESIHLGSATALLHALCMRIHPRERVDIKVKFCMNVGYVKSQHKDVKSPLKGAWSRSRDPL